MPTKDYNEYLESRLQDRDEAAAYLTACFQDSDEVFYLGLGKVIAAQGGVEAVTSESDLGPEELEQILSEPQKRELSSLSQALRSLGFRVQITPRDREKVAA